MSAVNYRNYVTSSREIIHFHYKKDKLFKQHFLYGTL